MNGRNDKNCGVGSCGVDVMMMQKQFVSDRKAIPVSPFVRLSEVAKVLPKASLDVQATHLPPPSSITSTTPDNPMTRYKMIVGAMSDEVLRNHQQQNNHNQGIIPISVKSNSPNMIAGPTTNHETALMDPNTIPTIMSMSFGTMGFANLPPRLQEVRNEVLISIAVIMKHFDIDNLDPHVRKYLEDRVQKVMNITKTHPRLFMFHIPTNMGAPCHGPLNDLIDMVIKKRNRLLQKYRHENDFLIKKKHGTNLQTFTSFYRPLVRFRIKDLFQKIHHPQGNFTTNDKQHFRTRFSILSREWNIKI